MSHQPTRNTERRGKEAQRASKGKETLAKPEQRETSSSLQEKKKRREVNRGREKGREKDKMRERIKKRREGEKTDVSW
jgi:hypothetical protein